MPGRDHCGKLNLLRTDAVWFTWNKKGEVSWDRRKNRLQKAICRRTRKRGVCFTNKKAEVHEACWAEAKGKRGETICSVQFCYRHRQTANKHRERQILWREDVLIVTGLDKECTVRQPLLALPVCVFFFFFWGKSTLDRCRANIWTSAAAMTYSHQSLVVPPTSFWLPSWAGEDEVGSRVFQTVSFSGSLPLFWALARRCHGLSWKLLPFIVVHVGRILA